MLLLDDLLLAPGTAVMKIFEELARKAHEELLDDGPLKKELQHIYALLESGKLSESDFATREHELLLRLEQIARTKLALPEPEAPPVESAPEILPPALDFSAFDVPRVELPTLELPPVELPRTDFRLVESPRVEVASAPVCQVAAPVPAAAPPLLPLPAAVPPAPAAVAPTPAPAARPLPFAPEAPAVAAAGLAEPLNQPPPVRMNTGQVVESALRGLAMLKMRVSSVTAVTRAPGGWHVIAELIESRAVPDTSDLLGVYEVQLDEDGNILGYARTRMRRRCDLGDRR